MKRKTVNYLNNKDMLAEIHKSKLSYCDYNDDLHGYYDIIVEDLEQISHSIISEAKVNKAKRLSEKAYKEYLLSDEDEGKKAKDFKIDPDTISTDGLIIRHMTWEHIPEDLKRKKTHRTVADRHVKLNFVPFVHHRLTLTSYDEVEELLANGNYRDFLTLVLRSHYKDGKFSVDHGTITDKLSKMYLMLTDKYAQKGNWRGYSYINDMKGQAIIELASKGLFFNEYKSDNPFSYFTQVITNGFRIVLNKEKRNQNIRDDLLESMGQAPSIARQISSEDKIRQLRDEANGDDR